MTAANLSEKNKDFSARFASAPEKIEERRKNRAKNVAEAQVEETIAGAKHTGAEFFVFAFDKLGCSRK